jgi:hypothetical protein
VNTLEHLLSLPITYFLGWSLLHFLWQGLVTAGILSFVLFLLRHRSANARYLVSCGALGLMILLPAMTIGIMWANSIPFLAIEVSYPFSRAGVRGTEIPRRSAPGLSKPARVLPIQTFEERFEGYVPWAVPGWIIGVLILSVRFVFGFVCAQRVKKTKIQEAPESWRKKLEELRQRMKVSRPVRLLESYIVRIPLVIGHFKPVILIPACAITGLSPVQIEVILAHELAHIRRHDYLINLIQTVVEILLFYHPAVWWISRRIRWEREHCCDDAAVEIYPNRIEYARALVAMEEFSTRFPSAAVAAGGGSLLLRISRLLNIQFPKRTRPVRSLAGGVVLVIVVSLLAGIHFSYANQPFPPLKVSKKAKFVYGRVADHSTRADILREFGEPECYRWGSKILDENRLPERYVMCYPPGVQFYFKGDRLLESRIENIASFPLQENISQGASVEDIIKSMGPSKKIIYGGKNQFENVVEVVPCKDIKAKKGDSYYARVDKHRRYMVSDNMVSTVCDTIERYSSPKSGWSGRKITISYFQTPPPDQQRKISDKIDYPFVDDPEALGTWMSTDYVEEIDDFIPVISFLQPAETRGLSKGFPLATLVFDKKGTLSSQGTWTKGLVLNPVQKTASKYVIKNIDGSRYLFLEWKNEDYTLQHLKPAYLVFKKAM